MLRNLIYIAVLLLGGSFTASAQTQYRVLPMPLEDGGNRAFLGIMSEKISKEKAEKLGFDNPYGSYVSSVINNTAAEKAGIRPFDYIYGIDDDVTSRTVNLASLLGNYEPGDKIDVHLIRSGSKRKIKATLGTREDADYSAKAKEEDAFFGVSPAYSSTKAADGALINVVDGSSAQRIGLKNGDIIVEFNGHRILDWTDLTIAINMAGAGKSISVNYIRNGNKGNATGLMGSASDRSGQKREPIVVAPNPGEKAFLGVVSDRLSTDKVRKLGLENPYGYYITEVVEGSAAHHAGLQPMDYLYGIDQYRVGEEVSLGTLLKKFEPGEAATVHYVRKGKARTSKVNFTSKSEVKKSTKDKESKAPNACEKPFLGIMQGYDEDPNDVSGVQVNIVENSSAEDAGLEDGDIIMALNGYCMVDWDDITLVLKQLKPGDPLRIDYSHHNQVQSANVKIKSYSETKKCDDCDCGKKEYSIRIDTREVEDDLEELGDDLEELGEDLGEMIRIRTRGYDIETVDVSSYEVAVSQADAAELNQLNVNYGTDLSTRQDLGLKSIRIAAYPEQQEFRLAFDLASVGTTSVEIYNQKGRRIYQYEASGFSGPFEDVVNIGQNGPGDYYLYIRQDGKSAVRKIRLTEK
ncbi:MAG: PDZ domain-containing protein [Bacteroidetes bacterium]|nr:PDZ domain-containing protein [Bacteroidota bacterium]